MKKTFDQTKKETAKISANAFGIRSIAILMFFVMLFTAIGSGSVLSALAVTRGDEGADDSVAESVEVSEDFASSADLYDTEEALLGRKSDSDLAATGANADLAASGSPNYISYGFKADGNSSTLAANKVSGATISFTSDNSNDYYFVSASDDANFSTSLYSNAYPGYSYSGYSISPGGSENNNHYYGDGSINWVECYRASVSGIKLQVVSGTTVSVTYNNGTYTVTVTSGGGTTPTESPATESPSEGSTTNTVNQTSGKTMLIAYHSNTKWTHAHIWYDGGAVIKDGTTTAGAMSSYSTDTKLKYIDITSVATTANKQIDFIVKNGTGWNDYQSSDQKKSDFVKGVQYYAYTKTNTDTNPTNTGIYTPLKLVSIEEPSSILKGQSSSFKVNTDGGVPWFYSEKLSGTAKNYTLKVGTTSGGSDVLAASTFNYTAKSKSFTWTPSSSGSVTLYYTLTDGIDTVTYSKAYTVIEPEAKHAVTFNTSGSGTVTPATGTVVGESTPTTITATPADGYEFSSWTFGDGITGDSTTNATTTITTKSSGTYTVTANFTKKNLTVTKGTHDHGDFSLSKTTNAHIGDTITISDITIDKGYTDVSFSTTPTTDISGSGTADHTFTMPGENVEVNATYTPKSGNTITGTASPAAGLDTFYIANIATGTNNYTIYTVGSDARYARVKAKDAYTFDKFVITYGDGSEVTVNAASATYDSSTKFYTTQLNTDGSKFSSDNDGSISVVAYFTKKPTHKVTVVSNNNALGTATASVTDAYEGQTVTLTPKEDTGSFSSWSVTSGGVTVNSNTFTMGSSDVAITATFVAYSGTSNFYYNSYGSNGQPASSRYGAQMQKAKIGGVEYSYYHVSGRTESDQLFTVSYGDPANNGTVYFVTPDGWTDKHGWDASTIDAQFYGSDGELIQTWSNMTSDDYYGSDRCFKISIPKAARKVQFRAENNDPDTSNWPATALFDLNDLAYHVDCIYISEYHKNDGGQFDKLGAKNRGNTSKPIADGFFENYNGTNKYTNNFSSGGFSNHNATRGASHSYTKPNNLGEAQRSDYYVLVLYNGKTYTINGETKTIDKDPEIIWLPELPDSGDTIKVYAKDGAIRSGLQTYGNMADTTVLKADGTTSAGATSYGSDGQTYEVYKAQPGETIVIQTTIATTTCTGATDTYRDRFYVRGFSINGEVPQLLEPNNTGVYTQRYTVPEDYADKYVEITPIYFLKDTTNNPVVTFRATNFPKGQHNWGNVPYCYPFYGNLSDKDNAFGAYPGQPLIFFKGNYSMQVPVKSTSPFSDDGANTNVAGITMSNGYYDTVHKLIMGYGDNSTSADHVQTYDYGDFWKIFNEKKPVDNIVFDFKYKDTKHNLIDDTTGNSIAKSTLTDKYTNGFELLKNFHGRNVDLFGKALSGDVADPTKTPAVYVVSIGGINDGVGGVENIAGFYATEWRVYAPNDKTSVSTTYKKMSAGGKSSIPPEVLVLNDDDATSFNNTTYPSAVDKTGKSYKVTDWQSLYQALEDYRDLPVYISYEAADAQNGAEDYQTGTHGATRNDGRWLYSKNNESITGKIRIDVSQNQGATYTPNDQLSTPVEGIDAYFTNDGVEGEKTYATTSDPDKTFNFEAKTTNGEYKFMGWYLDDEHSTKITGDNVGFTERFQSQTFVARFMHVTSGQLILSHTAETNETYKGIGTVSIGAVVKNGDGSTYKTYAPSTSDITLDDKIVRSDSDMTVDVTLTATRSENGNNGTTILDTPSGQESTFFDYGNFTLSADEKTRTFSFEFPVSALFTGDNQTVKNLIYHSYFTQFTFNYVFKFEAPMRDGSTKYYFKDGTLTPKQIENYVTKKYNEQTEINDRYITKDFVESIAPFESNFATDVSWLIGDEYPFTVTSDVYTVESFVKAKSEADNKFDVTFNLPYDHINGVATLNGDGTGTYNVSAENFSLIKDGATDNRVTLGKIPNLLGTDVNGIYSEEEKSKWIAAPTKLSNGEFFQYWSITRTSDKIEVARCYFPGFNFAALDNYEITAVYGTSQTNLANSGVSTSVTYLETTRNQWNSSTSVEGQKYAPDVNKTTNSSDYQSKAADMLYNDFVLSYNYNGVFISEDTEGAANITDLGLVVERVKELNTFDDGSYDTNIASYTGIAQKTDDVKAAAAQNNQQYDINGTRYYKSTVAKSELDNKNRILFYDAFFNTAGWNHEKQKPVYGYTYKKYVYRAYSYITYNDNGTSKTVLSETPAYFIMYDVATADYKSN